MKPEPTRLLLWERIGLALFALVPPGRILFGSDVPFGDPSLNALITLRCALEAGLQGEQIESVIWAMHLRSF